MFNTSAPQNNKPYSKFHMKLQRVKKIYNMTKSTLQISNFTKFKCVKRMKNYDNALIE